MIEALIFLWLVNLLIQNDLQVFLLLLLTISKLRIKIRPSWLLLLETTKNLRTKKELNVLLLDDPIDEFCVQNLGEYEKKKLKNVAKGDVKFGDEDDAQKKKEKKRKKRNRPEYLYSGLKNFYFRELRKIEFSEEWREGALFRRNPK